MNDDAFSRSRTILATVLLVCGLIAPVKAESYGATGMLEEAYLNLAFAKPAYKGHRAKAMEHVKSAISILGGKARTQTKGKQPQGNSDAKLHTAQGLLQQSRAGLSGEALSHVNAAIQELSIALTVATEQRKI